MSLLEILLIVLVISATVLCFYVISVLQKVLMQINEIQKDVKQLVNNTIPLLKNLNEVTVKANRIVTSAESYWESVERSIDSVKMKISSFTSPSKFGNSNINARGIIQNIRAFTKGFSAFWKEFRRS